jgi:SAM-dependent methyltransferase
MKFKELINAPLTNIYAMWELQLIMERLKFDREDEVLDVGTGNGFAGFILSKYVKKFVGIDISKPIIDFLKKVPKPNNVEFLEMDATLDPPKEMLCAFDKVICIDTLQYVKNPKSLINFIEKVLKQGGTVAITFPLINPFRNKKYFTKDEVYNLLTDVRCNYSIEFLNLDSLSFLIGKVYIKIQTMLEGMGDPDRFEDEVCFKMMQNPKPIHKLYKFSTILLFKLTRNPYIKDENGIRVLIKGKKLRK